jgi:hypothetical protein
MIYLANSISLQMFKDLIRKDWELNITLRELSVEEAKVLLSTYFTSAVGHAGTAQFLTELLGIAVPMSRQAITLKNGDKLIVVQPLGERLPPGQELTAEVLKEWYREGKVKFILIQVP